MKEIVSFLLLLSAYGVGSMVLHLLVNTLGLNGLGAFIVYCIPLLSVISYTTMEDSEKFVTALGRNAMWGYGFILSVAGVAWVISA